MRKHEWFQFATTPDLNMGYFHIELRQDARKLLHPLSFRAMHLILRHIPHVVLFCRTNVIFWLTVLPLLQGLIGVETVSPSSAWMLDSFKAALISCHS